MMRPWLAFLIAAFLASSVATAPSADDERPVVATTFYPLTYLAERIGAGDVRVICPVPKGADPASWSPDADTIRLYQAADLVLQNGAGFETWTERVSLPRATCVETSRGFKDEWLSSTSGATHSHGTAGEHSHTGTNGHTWLDPLNALKQAQAILDSLSRLVPERTQQLDARFRELARDLKQLDEQFRNLGQLDEGVVLLASHPSYDYLGQRYGWPIVNLHLDPEVEMGQAELTQLAHELGQVKARVMLWEAPPLPETLRELRDRFGLESIVFSPCEHRPSAAAGANADYLTVMRANIERLRPSFPAPKTR